MAAKDQVDSALGTEPVSTRGEIDTSAPFESVKEAANRFGGMGFWRPTCHKAAENAYEHTSETVDVNEVKEQAAELERDLILKERETLDVLKELEATKNVAEELKLKLQKEASEPDVILKEDPLNDNINCVALEPDEGALDRIPSASPGLILLELKQAKVNITRTTHDLADIRATVDAYKTRIEKERLALEKTRQRLISSASEKSSLEEELNQTKEKLERMKDTKDQDVSRDISTTITSELQKLSSEVEQFKKVGEAARFEVLRAMTEIEETKARINTAGIRLVAAKKMKEAAEASEAVALAEIRAISKSTTNGHAPPLQESEAVTLTLEEYSYLVSKSREAEKEYKDRVADAMSKVDEANISKTEILKKVEEATEEVKITKKSLEEALGRVEAANKGKLAVEEALRMWRCEHSHKRRSVCNTTKFKNPHPSAHRKESVLLDVNGLLLARDEHIPVVKPTISIGQILSRKLLLSEDYETGPKTEKSSMGKSKVSLAQMLTRPDYKHSAEKYGKENNEPPLTAKRKKFGFARITLLVAKQNKKKKKQITTSLCRCRSAIN